MAGNNVGFVVMLEGWFRIDVVKEKLSDATWRRNDRLHVCFHDVHWPTFYLVISCK